MINDSLSEQFARFLLDNNLSIRQTAKHFNIPKSTIHYAISKKLKHINYPLFLEIKNKLKINFDTKHIRGGMATKKKYEQLKLSKLYSSKILDSTNNFETN